MFSSSNWESLEDCLGVSLLFYFPGCFYIRDIYFCLESGARSWFSWKKVSFSKGCSDASVWDLVQFSLLCPFSYKISIFVG